MNFLQLPQEMMMSNKSKKYNFCITLQEIFNKTPLFKKIFVILSGKKIMLQFQNKLIHFLLKGYMFLFFSFQDIPN